MDGPLFTKDLCETSPDGDFVICPLCGEDSISRHLAEAAIALEEENKRLKAEIKKLTGHSTL